MLGRLLILLSVLALVPVTAVADLASAQKLYEDGRADEALTEVDSLLASSPADPELRFLKGVIFAEHGKNDEAIEIFAALTRDYPELPEPYNNLAVLFAEKGEFEKAREALLAAIQTHPSYSTAHENLGDLYAKMASLAYDRALEEDKANESARIKLSQVNSLFSMPQRSPRRRPPSPRRRSRPLPPQRRPPSRRRIRAPKSKPPSSAGVRPGPDATCRATSTPTRTTMRRAA